ncbi:cupin domain-containing protein [Caballeronia sp. 15715]|uniref:cupin domain-containing protein n=1 Tax=unclassified Caballeronia TaxID=2646786 RepID=UPI0039E5D999
MLLIRRFAIVLSLIFLTIPAFAASADNPESAVSTVLMRTERSWDGTLYKGYPAGQPQLTVLKIIIPPHTTLPWHTHSMPNAAYVPSGDLHVDSRDGRHKTTLHAGDVLPEMVGSSHRG